MLNKRQSPVVSVDVPSGLNGDDNQPYDPCVRADLTVTYGLPKLGLLLEPGYTYAGKLVAQEIGFPPASYGEFDEDRHLITAPDVAGLLPGKNPVSHKGDAGRLAVLAGSEQYPGAPFLVGNAASTSGVGLTALIGPENLSAMAGRSERDLVFPYTLDGILFSERPAEQEEFLNRQNGFVIGPGLGQSKRLRDGLVDFLREMTQPAVLDADGLNNLREDLEVISDCEGVVLTPHPGEASRLLGSSPETVRTNPIESVKKLVNLTHNTVVLKSSRPVVGHPDGTISVNVTGTAALAKAGTGDVLSGIVGGFLAQGLDPGPASCLGLYLHGASGRVASEELNTISVRSQDVVESLPPAIRELKRGAQPDWFPVRTESQYEEVLGWNPFPN